MEKVGPKSSINIEDEWTEMKITTKIYEKLREIKRIYSRYENVENVYKFLTEAIATIPDLRRNISKHIEFYRILDSLDHDTDDDTSYYISNFYNDPAHLCSRLSESSHGEEFDEGLRRMHEIRLSMDSRMLLYRRYKYFRFDNEDLCELDDVREIIENLLIHNHIPDHLHFNFVYHPSYEDNQNYEGICRYLYSKLEELKSHPFLSIPKLIGENFNKLINEKKLRKFITTNFHRLIEIFKFEKPRVKRSINLEIPIERSRVMDSFKHFLTHYKFCPFCGSTISVDKITCPNCKENRKTAPLSMRINLKREEIDALKTEIIRFVSGSSYRKFSGKNSLFSMFDIFEALDEERIKLIKGEEELLKTKIVENIFEYRVLKYLTKLLKLFIFSDSRQFSFPDENESFKSFIDQFMTIYMDLPFRNYEFVRVVRDIRAKI